MKVIFLRHQHIGATSESGWSTYTLSVKHLDTIISGTELNAAKIGTSKLVLKPPVQNPNHSHKILMI